MFFFFSKILKRKNCRPKFSKENEAFSLAISLFIHFQNKPYFEFYLFDFDSIEYKQLFMLLNKLL